MITVLDYGAGNVRSVINALETIGETVRVVRTPGDILNAEKLVFPGVGSFGTMMQTLEAKGLVEPLRQYLIARRPFWGICLGLQALFEGSDEAPGVQGLGILRGRVNRLPAGLSVPHIGWNGITARQPSVLFDGLRGDEKVYFVHSYHVVPEDPAVVLTTTDYGQRFVSGIQSGPMVATQFHPEKSGATGLGMLKRFMSASAPARVPDLVAEPTQLAKRIIACLDVRQNDQGELVVTKGDQYDVREQGRVRSLGSPVELARRYYEEGADEITFLNITGFRGSPLQDVPMLDVLRQTSKDVFVPLTIGGGIRDFTDDNGRFTSALEVASEYFRSGADKISIGSDAVLIAQQVMETGQVTGRSAIETIARVYGNQAVVISIDPRRVCVARPQDTVHRTIRTSCPGPRGEQYCWYECTVSGGREGRNVDALTVARVCQDLGAGEILLNSIDRDGQGAGFDLELIRAMKEAVSLPVIASSGAGSVQHFAEVFTETSVESALAAGIFHRREVPIEAVKSHLAGIVEIRR